jgi:hypothetical protein
VSRLPESDVGPAFIEMSGSKRNLANSLSEDSHRGVRVAMCGFMTSTKYFCSVLAT